MEVGPLTRLFGRPTPPPPPPPPPPLPPQAPAPAAPAPGSPVLKEGLRGAGAAAVVVGAAGRGAGGAPLGRRTVGVATVQPQGQRQRDNPDTLATMAQQQRAPRKRGNESPTIVVDDEVPVRVGRSGRAGARSSSSSSSGDLSSTSHTELQRPSAAAGATGGVIKPLSSIIGHVAPAPYQVPQQPYSYPRLGPVRKRNRFNKRESAVLHSMYKKTRYPSDEQVQELASSLGANVRRVRIWFNNQRAASNALDRHYERPSHNMMQQHPLEAGQLATGSP